MGADVKRGYSFKASFTIANKYVISIILIFIKFHAQKNLFKLYEAITKSILIPRLLILFFKPYYHHVKYKYKFKL